MNPAHLSIRTGILTAALGALAATMGDLGQLWVVNAGRPALALPAPPGGLIVPATLAGVLGIPLYALGYAARARTAQGTAPGAAVVVMLAGTAFAVLGGSVHGITGVLISHNVGGMAGGLDPLQGVLSSGPISLTLWGLATAALLCAALAEARLPQPRASRLCNPLVLTLLLTAAAALLPLPWRDFVGPAAVNIAHLVFFLRLGVLA